MTATKPYNSTVHPEPNAIKTKGSVTLPYVGHVSDAMVRVLRKSGVMVHQKRYNHLAHPKDKVELEERAWVVNYIQCGDCSANYVGET